MFYKPALALPGPRGAQGAQGAHGAAMAQIPGRRSEQLHGTIVFNNWRLAIAANNYTHKLLGIRARASVPNMLHAYAGASSFGTKYQVSAVIRRSTPRIHVTNLEV